MRRSCLGSLACNIATLCAILVVSGCVTPAVNRYRKGGPQRTFGQVSEVIYSEHEVLIVGRMITTDPWTQPQNVETTDTSTTLLDARAAVLRLTPAEMKRIIELNADMGRADTTQGAHPIVKLQDLFYARRKRRIRVGERRFVFNDGPYLEAPTPIEETPYSKAARRHEESLVYSVADGPLPFPPHAPQYMIDLSEAQALVEDGGPTRPAAGALLPFAVIADAAIAAPVAVVCVVVMGVATPVVATLFIAAVVASGGQMH